MIGPPTLWIGGDYEVYLCPECFNSKRKCTPASANMGNDHHRVCPRHRVIGALSQCAILRVAMKMEMRASSSILWMMGVLKVDPTRFCSHLGIVEVVEDLKL